MIHTPGLIITVLVAVCLLLQVSICDAAQLYLTRTCIAVCLSSMTGSLSSG